MPGGKSHDLALSFQQLGQEAEMGEATNRDSSRAVQRWSTRHHSFGVLWTVMSGFHQSFSYYASFMTPEERRRFMRARLIASGVAWTFILGVIVSRLL